MRASFTSSRPSSEKTHFRGAVELAIGHANGEGRRDEAVVSVVLSNTPGHGVLYGVHLFSDPQVTLTIAEVAEHGPYRSVNFQYILAEEVGGSHALHVTSGVRKRIAPRSRERSPWMKNLLV